MRITSLGMTPFAVLCLLAVLTEEAKFEMLFDEESSAENEYFSGSGSISGSGEIPEGILPKPRKLEATPQLHLPTTTGQHPSDEHHTSQWLPKIVKTSSTTLQIRSTTTADPGTTKMTSVKVLPSLTNSHTQNIALTLRGQDDGNEEGSKEKETIPIFRDDSTSTPIISHYATTNPTPTSKDATTKFPFIVNANSIRKDYVAPTPIPGDDFILPLKSKDNSTPTSKPKDGAALKPEDDGLPEGAATTVQVPEMGRVHHHSVKEVTQPITTLPDAVHRRPVDEVTIPITTLPDMMHQRPMEEVIKPITILPDAVHHHPVEVTIPITTLPDTMRQHPAKDFIIPITLPDMMRQRPVEEVIKPITILPDAVHHHPVEVTIPITTLPDTMRQHPAEDFIIPITLPDMMRQRPVEEVIKPITILPDAVHHHPVEDLIIPITQPVTSRHQRPGKEVNKSFPTQPDADTPGNIKGSKIKNVATDESIFDKKEIVAAVIGGGIVGALLAGLLVALLIHRIRKKDSGSYGLEPKGVKTNGDYQMAPTQEIYA